MGQRLKKAAHTYSQFSNLIFDSLSTNEEEVGRTLILMSTRQSTAFFVYMNDHAVFAKTFDDMYEFLHKKYFPRVIFELVYLSSHKTVVMSDNLKLLSFQSFSKELRLSLKHREKIAN